MGIISRLFGREQRTQVISADDHLSALLGRLEISPETAGEIPAVSACIDFISTCIAGLPVKLYRENRTENTTEEVKDDNRLRLLNDETGDLLDPFQMKQALISDFFLYGAGYIYPEMSGNEFISLRYIRHGNISAYMGSDPVFKYGEYVLSNGMRLRDDEVVRLLRDTRDGMTGQSIILQHQQILSAMYREIIYEKMLVATGGNKKGFITVDDVKITKEAMNALHENWKRLYESTGSAMMILNKGLQFHESSNTSVEMQLNENKTRNNELICQLFGMSPDAVSGRLGDEGLVSTVKGAVIPVVTALETALNRGLLLPSERDLMYFMCDTSELLKGDILKRYQAYKTGLECNVLQIDEARYKEDLPPLGLNWIKLGLQDVLYDPKTKTIYTPNMNQSMTMSENTVSFGENSVDNDSQDGIIEERENNDPDYIQNTETGRMEGSRQSGGSDSGILTADGNMKLDDIQIHRSVGAKAKNYDVMDLQTGEKFHFVEGTKIQDVEVFAGKGVKTPYRNALKFVNKYGGKEKDWQHVKGKGVLDYYGEERRAEVHWSRCIGIGDHEFFIKRWLE